MQAFLHTSRSPASSARRLHRWGRLAGLAAVLALLQSAWAA